MYISGSDDKRQQPILKSDGSQDEPNKSRSVWRRDYARLVHSPSFRRLQGKTQLFPSYENDFFRNRLTHSIEVAQIAKSIALKLNIDISEQMKNASLSNDEIQGLLLNTDLVEFAALAHDLGHPPFGHQGEEALDECMLDDGGFEGNAQTLRILTRLEKRDFNSLYKHTYGFNPEDDSDERIGLNLTFRTLASVLKYDQSIPIRREEREHLHKELRKSGKTDSDSIQPVKGYYYTEKVIVDNIKKYVTNDKWESYVSNLESGSNRLKFKTIECQIMDIADDIAYSTYDLEDGFKAGFYTPLDLVKLDQEIIDGVINRVGKSISDIIDNEKNIIIEDQKTPFNKEFIISILRTVFKRLYSTYDGDKHNNIEEAYEYSKDICENGYSRTRLTSVLIDSYINAISIDTSGEIPAFWKLKMQNIPRIQIEILKRLTYEYQINSPKLKIAEYRGKDIVTNVFKALENGRGHELLPLDFRRLYNITIKGRKRLICDFIAGMTDRYLVEFYSRLFSEDPETIFKPI